MNYKSCSIFYSCLLVMQALYSHQATIEIGPDPSTTETGGDIEYTITSLCTGSPTYFNIVLDRYTGESTDGVFNNGSDMLDQLATIEQGVEVLSEYMDDYMMRRYGAQNSQLEQQMTRARNAMSNAVEQMSVAVQRDETSPNSNIPLIPFVLNRGDVRELSIAPYEQLMRQALQELKEACLLALTDISESTANYIS